MGQSANEHPKPRVFSSSLSRIVMPLVSHPIIPVIIIIFLTGLSVQAPVQSSAERPASQSASGVVLAEKIRIIHYFYSPGCNECLHAEGILGQLEDALPYVKIERYNMFEPGIMEIREVFDETYDVPSARRGAVPAVFAGQSWCFGVRELESAKDEGWLAEAV